MSTMHIYLYGLAVAVAVPLTFFRFLASSVVQQQPTVTILNGSYSGVYLPQYEQDLFLGIPYAQDTGGANRFRIPQSLTQTWDDIRPATEYSHACPDVNPQQDAVYGMSEDCLSINIVRPSGVGEDAKVPVMFWIHGGSWQEGTSGLDNYNLTWLVQRSTEIGKPIMGVSINYRKGVWGNIYSDEIQATGNANLGLRDIRKSLEWVQENIEAFGGDAGSVTIWGESSGAFAVGQLMMAYGGRTDGLFHRSIQESGSAGSAWYNGSDWYQAKYDQIVSQVDCATAVGTLDCLRTVPYETLYPFTNYYIPGGPLFYPTVDGDIIPAFPTQLLREGRFAHIPHLHGCNSDEGANNAPFGIISTDQELYAALSTQGWGYPGEVILEIMRLYPDDPTYGVPLETKAERFLRQGSRPNKATARFLEFGSQYTRASAIFGDVYYHGPLLDDARHYSKYNPNSTYIYRFNTRGFVNQTHVDPETNTTIVDRTGHLVPSQLGVAHATEIPFVFRNSDLVGPWPEYRKLSDEMSAAWILFAHSGNPNSDQANSRATQGLMNITWPAYGSTGAGTLGKNLVWQTDSQGGIYVEQDTYRLEGREYLQKWAHKRRV